MEEFKKKREEDLLKPAVAPGTITKKKEKKKKREAKMRAKGKRNWG